MSFNCSNGCFISRSVSLVHKNRALQECFKRQTFLQTDCNICDRLFKNIFEYSLLMHSDAIMQQDEIKIKPDEEVKQVETHSYNCQCPECQVKLGNLPVLLQGIEERQEQYEALNLSTPSTSGTKSTKTQIKCNSCDKTFTHRGDFNKHLRKHSGEKPYACSICNKKFSHTSNLSRHLTVHTGEKPYHCDKCGKDFSRKDKLELHKTTKICKKRANEKT